MKTKDNKEIILPIDLWDELSDYQKKQIQEAKLEIIAGKGKPHEKVMQKYKKRFVK